VPHFHPDGKEPSSFTKAFQSKQRESLPFEDERDFEEHQKGLIAAPDYTQIMSDAGGLHALFGALIDFDLLFEMTPGTVVKGKE